MDAVKLPVLALPPVDVCQPVQSPNAQQEVAFVAALYTRLLESAVKLSVGGGMLRVAVQLAFTPPLEPKQVHETEAPWAGKAGLAGLAVPGLQSVPEKVVAEEI